MQVQRIPDIASINLTARIANLLDANGEETDDAAQAVALVVGPVAGMWLAGRVDAFPRAAVH